LQRRRFRTAYTGRTLWRTLLAEWPQHPNQALFRPTPRSRLGPELAKTIRALFDDKAAPSPTTAIVR
jgi:hypothetical protein